MCPWLDSYTTMGSVEYAAKKAKVFYTPLSLRRFDHHTGEPGWGAGTVTFSPRPSPCPVQHGRSLIPRLQQTDLRFQPRDEHGSQGDALRTLAGRDGLLLAPTTRPDGARLRLVADLMTGPGRRPGLAHAASWRPPRRWPT